MCLWLLMRVSMPLIHLCAWFFYMSLPHGCVEMVIFHSATKFFFRGTIKALSVGFIILYDVGSHCFQDYITLVVTLWIMENLNSCKNFFYLNYLKSLHFNKKWNILVENNKIGLFYQNLQTYYIPEYFFTPVASSIMVQVCG